MNSREWLISHGVDSSKAMCDALDQALIEQRQRCANAIAEDGYLLDMFDCDIEMMKESCLNAVEKEDE